MKTRACLGLVLVATGFLAASPSAAETAATRVKTMHLNAPLEALAISGNRVAYDVQSIPSKSRIGVTPNRVVVWNLRTGGTTTVSGRGTAGVDGVVGGGVRQLAIAGAQVAWHAAAVSNEEGDDDLYSSSALVPKERHLRQVVREGDACGGAAGPVLACAGTWIGGPVASGNRILVNRWTTDTTGAITNGGLYTLHNRTLRRFAPYSAGVEVVAADARRVAVLQWRWHAPETTINVFSAGGRLVTSVTPTTPPQDVALSGRNLLVLESRGKLELYDAQTGALKKTFTLHRGWQGRAIAVHGNVAVYSTPLAPRPVSRVRALDLTTGKDRLIAYLPGQIPLLRMNSVGLVYANNEWTGRAYSTQLVFRPFADVAAAVQ